MTFLAKFSTATRAALSVIGIVAVAVTTLLPDSRNGERKGRAS